MNDITNISKQIADLINKHQNFWVTTHIHPDGDGLASMLLMKLLLEQHSKNVIAIVDDHIPRKFDFFHSFHEIITDVADGRLGQPDIVFALDASNISRLGDIEKIIPKSATLINIDHHVSNDYFGDINLVVGEASSAAEVTWQVLEYCNVKMNSNVATLVYSGIICDTGRFTFPNTSARALDICSKMVSEGASSADIADKIYFRSSQSTILGLVESLSTLQFHYQGKVASMVLSNDFMCKHDHIDTEGFVDNLLAVDGTEVEFFMKEHNKDCFRVSFRSKNHVDVNEVAKIFGGGGHRRAAGATICGDAQTVKLKIVDALETFFN
ncbi:DHH family phosphoesterase [bacterium]|nr:DHH family phosphoesterase [bacterium]